jgi:hypothetical protein
MTFEIVLKDVYDLFAAQDCLGQLGQIFRQFFPCKSRICRSLNIWRCVAHNGELLARPLSS